MNNIKNDNNKIKFGDIDFSVENPRKMNFEIKGIIKFEDIDFSEVDPDEIDFEKIDFGKIDFSSFADGAGLVECVQPGNRIVPKPFYDKILELRDNKIKTEGIKQQLLVDKDEIGSLLTGYAQIRDLFSERERLDKIERTTANKSIGERRKTPQSGKKIKETGKINKALEKVKLYAACTVVALSLGALAGILVSVPDIEHNKNAAIVNAAATEYAITIAEEKQIGAYNANTKGFKYYVEYENNIDFGLGDTTPENYDDLKQIYAFYKADPEGFKKLITTISYIDPITGEKCNYTDINQFLRINGFYSYRGNEQIIESEEVFVEEMEKRLIEENKALDKNSSLYQVNNNSVMKGV